MPPTPGLQMRLLSSDELEVVAETRIKEAAEQNLKAEFRNYVDSPLQARVQHFYELNHKFQTHEFATEAKARYSKLDKKKMSIMEAIEFLNEIVDDSDPDVDNAQIFHLVQTGESLRRMFPGEEYDWLHLVGFIHDLGKVLAHPKVFNEPQWAVVGDTHPVGCAFSDSCVFPQFFKANPDSEDPRYNTKFGIYQEGVGLNNVHFSWGHDEYLYQVCVGNKCTLPQEALYVIRFHSFYPWHNKGAYDHLCNDQDRAMLKWVKAFQAHDLYSKLPEEVKVEEVLPYYEGLIKKYFPPVLNW
eukprot:TRINITY_DN5513_c0_g1_i2.p1 TRINITY_DN5513_c0_g1~~TRINITY_DN5513_c0_g1_i2.p1  ORF type:complete len:310 (+),score=106.32 TRINITY_DN5513_c0_g1_i2:35-931(+)